MYVGLFGYTLNADISNIGVVISGEVNGNFYVGGLVGRQNGSRMTNSYTAGNVTGYGTVGGLVGVKTNNTITNGYCYKYIKILRNGVPVSHIVDNPTDIHGGTVNAFELMIKATYDTSHTSWDFYPAGPWYWDNVENFP